MWKYISWGFHLTDLFRVGVIPSTSWHFILSQSSVTPNRHLFKGCHITQFGLGVTGQKSVRNLQALTTFSSTERCGGGTCSERAVSVPRGSGWNDTGLIKSTGANGDPRCPYPWRWAHSSWNKLVFASLTCSLCRNAREKQPSNGGPRDRPARLRVAVHQGSLSRLILWVVNAAGKNGEVWGEGNRLEGSMRMNQSRGISPALISRLAVMASELKTWFD